MMKQKEKRVALHVMVLPKTKERVNSARGQRSQGAYVDDLVFGIAQVVETTPKRPAFDVQRVQTWIRDERRQGAAEAFTEGDERQVAYCFEESVTRTQEALPEFSLSAWAKSTLARFGEQYGGDERAVWDMVVEFFESCGGVCAACRERLGAVARPAEAPLDLEPDGPEMKCAHRGETFRIAVGAPFTDLCPSCFLAGHRGDVRDCRACGEGRSI